MKVLDFRGCKRLISKRLYIDLYSRIITKGLNKDTVSLVRLIHREGIVPWSWEL